MASTHGWMPTSTSTTASPTTAPDDDPTTGHADVSSTGGEGSTSTGREQTGSPGCNAAVGLAEGEHAFTLDGYDRRYVVRLPENYSSDRTWPLIFAPEGCVDDDGCGADDPVTFCGHPAGHEWPAIGSDAARRSSRTSTCGTEGTDAGSNMLRVGRCSGFGSSRP